MYKMKKTKMQEMKKIVENETYIQGNENERLNMHNVLTIFSLEYC
jgi:hypothetical protein